MCEHVCVCVCMCVCVCACVCVCVHMCVCVCAYVRLPVCAYVRLPVCAYVRLPVCAYLCDVASMLSWSSFSSWRLSSGFTDSSEPSSGATGMVKCAMCDQWVWSV